MGKEQPTWLNLVQRFERTIGEPVETWVRSDGYFDVVTHATRAYGRWTRAVDEIQAKWLHFFNLPAASDITAAREQLARVERRLAEIRKELEALGRDGDGGVEDDDGGGDADGAPSPHD